MHTSKHTCWDDPQYCIYWLWKSLLLCSHFLIGAGGSMIAGSVNVCHFLSCPKRKASCCGEGHLAPKTNWLRKECGFLHNKELEAQSWAERQKPRQDWSREVKRERESHVGMLSVLLKASWETAPANRPATLNYIDVSASLFWGPRAGPQKLHNTSTHTYICPPNRPSINVSIIHISRSGGSLRENLRPGGGGPRL